MHKRSLRLWGVALALFAAVALDSIIGHWIFDSNSGVHWLAEGVAWAVPAFRTSGGVRYLAGASAGTAGTAANPVEWSDNTAKPNLRFGDGTADEYVSACAVTSNGDYCSWNGTNWVRTAAGGGSGTVTSIVIGTGLASTQSPLTTTGTMSVDQSFSPSWTGTHTFTTHPIGINNGVTAGGPVANDFSGGTGQFLTSTGANTLSGTTTLAANKNLLCAAGTTQLDLHLGTGTWLPPTGGLAANLAFSADNSTLIGAASSSAQANSSYQWWSRQPTLSGGGGLTVAPANGDTTIVLLGAVAVTSITVTGSPTYAQRFTVLVKQDGTGGRSCPTTWTNVRFPGGTYTVSAGANKTDKLDCAWDNTDSKWDCSVSLNLS